MLNLGVTEVLVILLVFVVPTVLVARYAQRKGYSALVFALIGIIASPILAGLIAYVLPDKRLAPGTPGGPFNSTGVELERLARLHDDGKLTDDEYAAAKARALESADGPVFTRRA